MPSPKELNPRKITIPRGRGYVTCRRKGTFEAKYWHAGTERRRKLEARTREEAALETKRLFAEFLLQGAKYAKPAYKPKKRVGSPYYNPPNKYITVVKLPYKLSLPKEPKRAFATYEEAVAFRDAWLRERGMPVPPPNAIGEARRDKTPPRQ